MLLWATSSPILTQANAALDPGNGVLGDGLSQLRFDDGLGEGVGEGPLGEREDRSGAPTEQAELPPWACS